MLLKISKTNPHSVYHGVLSKRPRSGIVVKAQVATRCCPEKLEITALPHHGLLLKSSQNSMVHY
jgi:hypothetical protein